MKASPYKFFGLLLLISLPFWVVGSIVRVEVLPGVPLSAAMVVVPLLTAVILIGRHKSLSVLSTFLMSALDASRIKLWVWPFAIGLMPMVMLVSAIIQSALGESLPAFTFDAGDVLLLFSLFFLAATLEELGWTGYATRPMVQRYGILGAGIAIGIVSAVWHLVPLLQVERAWDWVACWALGTVSRRVLIVWMFVRGGQSVFSASLLHAMSNVSWMLFPVMGSHFDPMVSGLILLAITMAVQMITWRRSSLSA